MARFGPLTFLRTGCYPRTRSEVDAMNEMEELSKLEPAGLPRLKPLLLDDLYQSVAKTLPPEIGRGPVLYLLSPSYSVLNPTPDEGITDFITRNETLLDYLKEAIVQNLAVYSVLIDISSYFIEQNNGLVLARLRERDSDGRRFEIKFYTHSPKELLDRYEDKIYIGRDFLDLFSPSRKYFGVKDAVVSLKAQFDINAHYRTINHYVIELHDTTSEFENLLRFKERADFVRYVTKYKKDVTNLISYFNIKVNGVIAQRIHACKAKHA